jgi:hypothetical protein
MATYHTAHDFDAFVLTKFEAVQLISLLAAQLGDTNVQCHQVGAAAEFIARDVDKSGWTRRIVMSVEPEKPGPGRMVRNTKGDD